MVFHRMYSCNHAPHQAIGNGAPILACSFHLSISIAVVAPDWLQGQVQLDWLERYGHRAEEYRFPNGAQKRQQFLHQVGKDGWDLLAAMQSDPTSQWMLSIPAVDTLQRVWKQDYLPLEQGGTWRADEERLGASKLFYSPYDLDAAAGTKRDTHWIGYVRRVGAYGIPA